MIHKFLSILKIGVYAIQLGQSFIC